MAQHPRNPGPFAGGCPSFSVVDSALTTVTAVEMGKYVGNDRVGLFGEFIDALKLGS
jgi:hypothetical protein